MDALTDKEKARALLQLRMGLGTLARNAAEFVEAERALSTSASYAEIYEVWSAFSAEIFDFKRMLKRFEDGGMP